MNRFAQWIEDMRWAMNVKRARAYRRKLIFSKRLAFDRALRPIIEVPFKSSEDDDPKFCIIDYPDAFYHVNIDDLCRAMIASAK